MKTFVERHAAKIRGTLSCFDRVVITGTLPDIAYAGAMATYLTARHVRLFDYPQWAAPLREEIRAHAEQVAREAGLDIEFIHRKDFRKEARIQALLAERGDHPGLVHIFSAMEPCPSFRPWHDKLTGRTLLKSTGGKCLHYYFYFLDPEFGLCYLRVPTWAPFRLQFYFNGHNWLAARLRRAKVAYTLVENTFVEIADWGRAQTLADDFAVWRLHRPSTASPAGTVRFWRTSAPAITGAFCRSSTPRTWSSRGRRLRAALRRPHPHRHPRGAARSRGDLPGAQADRRVAGRTRQQLRDPHPGDPDQAPHGAGGPQAVRQVGVIGRVECTTNDVTFFKHHRLVEHRDGTAEYKLAAVRKTIYSLPDLRDLMRAATAATWTSSRPSTTRSRACASWRRSPSRCARTTAAIAA